jgi:hypothetical protein
MSGSICFHCPDYIPWCPDHQHAAYSVLIVCWLVMLFWKAMLGENTRQLGQSH